METRIQIGTSGWFYEHWNETFYPNEIQADQRLKYYSQFFSTVEINSTFYHLPTEKAVSNWHRRTPSDFIFSVKASRYITHQKRLKDFEQTLPVFFERLEPLKKKVGPILFQLPPSFQKNAERLEEFLRFLPKRKKFVFEFRHPSWEKDEIYDLLQKYGIALCISDLNGRTTPLEVTGKFVYLRFHGPKKAYQGSYSSSQLQKWNKKFSEWMSNKKSVYCYFDNDEKAYAIKDALDLKKLNH